MKRAVILLTACVASVAALSVTGQNEPVKDFTLAGMLHLQPGPQTLSIVPKTVAGQIKRSVSKNAIMTLRDITLLPVKK
jgi:hypothetical protein